MPVDVAIHAHFAAAARFGAPGAAQLVSRRWLALHRGEHSSVGGGARWRVGASEAGCGTALPLQQGGNFVEGGGAGAGAAAGGGTEGVGGGSGAGCGGSQLGGLRPAAALPAPAPRLPPVLCDIDALPWPEEEGEEGWTAPPPCAALPHEAPPRSGVVLSALSAVVLSPDAVLGLLVVLAAALRTSRRVRRACAGPQRCWAVVCLAAATVGAVALLGVGRGRGSAVVPSPPITIAEAAVDARQEADRPSPGGGLPHGALRIAAAGLGPAALALDGDGVAAPSAQRHEERWLPPGHTSLDRVTEVLLRNADGAAAAAADTRAHESREPPSEVTLRIRLHPLASEVAPRCSSGQWSVSLVFYPLPRPRQGRAQPAGGALGARGWLEFRWAPGHGLVRVERAVPPTRCAAAPNATGGAARLG
jgi:hypothetical protein